MHVTLPRISANKVLRKGLSIVTGERLELTVSAQEPNRSRLRRGVFLGVLKVNAVGEIDLESVHGTQTVFANDY